MKTDLAHVGGEPCLLDLRHELPHWLPDPMHRRGLTVFRGIAHVDDGDEFIAFGPREDGLQEGGVEGTDPERGKPLILRGQHEVSGDDGSIDLSPILPVVSPHPGIGRLAPNG